MISNITTICQTQSNPTKRRRIGKAADVRLAAAEIFAPKTFCKKNAEHVDKMEWTSANKAELSQRTTRNDSKFLRASLFAIAQGKVERAADTIVHFLNNPSNIAMKKVVVSELCKETGIHQKILSSIRDSVAYHTDENGGTRMTAADTFVKDVAAAAVFSSVKDGVDISDKSIIDTVGISRRQVSHARARVKEAIKQKTTVAKVTRKRRKDYIRDVAQSFVQDYCRDDDFSRLDTNQGKMDIVDARTGETYREHRRIWRIVNKKQNHLLFVESIHYANFQKAFPGATIGYDIFRRVLGKVGRFMSKPTPESCVDPIITAVECQMAALHSIIRQPTVKEFLEQCDGGEGIQSKKLQDIIRSLSSHKMIESVCCEKEEAPEVHIDKRTPCPKFIPHKCANGECHCCLNRKPLRILDELMTSEFAEKEVKVTTWVEADRAGEKNGKQNKQMEQQTVEMTLKKLIITFKAQLEKTKKHYHEICWINYIKRIDFSCLPKNWMMILTDFAASMCLRALRTLNSSVDNHAVNANFVVVYDRRMVPLKGKQKDENGSEVDVEEDIEVFTIDVHHFFAESISKGKKNDHAMHNVCLDAIIKRYKSIFRDELGVELEHVIFWTDNAPHQYRCRQAFLPTASVLLRHKGIKITHRLAVVHNFKGYHDSVGKDCKYYILSLELEGTRSPNAFAVFVNCFNGLQKTFSDTMWKEYEAKNDLKLKNKGKWGMDSRTVWFVSETLEELDHLKAKHPEYAHRILLCDRSKIQDTVNHQSIKDTTLLHEVHSVATEVPPSVPGIIMKKKNNETHGLIRTWPVGVANFPCVCVHCRVNPV
ncbi:MAG: hypothetical protein ACPICB_06430, partial [Candidatus Poseidoniaceae archaeon]